MTFYTLAGCQTVACGSECNCCGGGPILAAIRLILYKSELLVDLPGLASATWELTVFLKQTLSQNGMENENGRKGQGGRIGHFLHRDF